MNFVVRQAIIASWKEDVDATRPARAELSTAVRELERALRTEGGGCVRHGEDCNVCGGTERVTQKKASVLSLCVVK